MKIDEILNDAPTKASIRKLLDNYFYIDGKYEIKGGVVNVDGHAKLVSSPMVLPGSSNKVVIREMSKLPVKFGTVTGDFSCREMPLSSLQNAPHFVGREFDCNSCKLTTLNYSPKTVGGGYYCYGNLLTSFEGVSETIKRTIMFSYGENLPLLKLLTIKELQMIEIHKAYDDDEIEMILNKYLGKGKSGMLACAAELTRAGHKENAKL